MFVSLCVLLVTLWIAGGASRADAFGQVIVRGAAAALLAGAVLIVDRPRVSARPVWLLLGGALLLALLQLIPLPPSFWQALPGRALLAEAAAASGQEQPWRPWAIVPGGAENAVASLLVPFATLLLFTGCRQEERGWVPAVLLGLIGAATLMGLLQFSGIALNNPFINDTPGQVSGSFANRNHLALFLALGCLLAPVWALKDGRVQWRVPTALALVLLLFLTILATGSRAGLLLGVLAIGIGLLLTRKSLGRMLDRYPRRIVIGLIAGVAAAFASVVLLSILADRAVSISRAVEVDPGQDMRRRGLPTVIAMIREYFPFGSGQGSFDPLFRMHEPFALLKPTYFNHAHNDFLEIVLDAGLPGLLLTAVALGWWAWAGVRAWRAGTSAVLPRLGWAMLLLVIIASIFDYPARTPMMMSIIVIAGVWLAELFPAKSASSLPRPS